MLTLCKKCAERCWNIFFQRIHHQILNFQRIQHKSYIVSAHSADFLQKYPLTAADPSTRVLILIRTQLARFCIFGTNLLWSYKFFKQNLQDIYASCKNRGFTWPKPANVLTF